MRSSPTEVALPSAQGSVWVRRYGAKSGAALACRACTRPPTRPPPGAVWWAAMARNLSNPNQKSLMGAEHTSPARCAAATIAEWFVIARKRPTRAPRIAPMRRPKNAPPPSHFPILDRPPFFCVDKKEVRAFFFCDADAAYLEETAAALFIAPTELLLRSLGPARQVPATYQPSVPVQF